MPYAADSIKNTERHRDSSFSAYCLLPAVCLLVFIACFFLVSCSREPDIKSPNTFTTGSVADAKRLMPFLASDSTSAEISGLIYHGLVKYDKDLKLTGDLAESWDVSRDGLRITFHLRKGVKWQDGVELTSDDVLFTYSTVIDPKVPTPYSSIYGPVSRVYAPDKYTVRVIYTESFAQ